VIRIRDSRFVQSLMSVNSNSSPGRRGGRGRGQSDSRRRFHRWRTAAARQAQVIAAIAPLLPRDALLSRSEDTTPYECDGLTAYRETPDGCRVTGNRSASRAVLKACHALGCRCRAAARHRIIRRRTSASAGRHALVGEIQTGFWKSIPRRAHATVQLRRTQSRDQ